MARVDSGISGFPPISRSDAEILILGSMPGEDSLRAGQYYAHPRNGFWPILMALLDYPAETSYSKKCEILIESRIALWDTLESCARNGSLDSSIINNSIIPNNFKQFFEKHPFIRAIFFNGRKAQEVYNRQVLPTLPEKFQKLKQISLPSTSPAMAMLNREQKRDKWSVILRELQTVSLLDN